MKTSIKASLVATAVAMLPLGGHAAGLGSIHVFSGIGQPLRAEVELNATADELQTLAARVASPEAFKQAGLQYNPALIALRLAVERRGNHAVVRISSDRPVNDPFVDLLIELNWAAGRLIREYTFLLDPVPVAPPDAGARTAAPVAAPVAAPAAVPARRGAASESGGAASAATSDRYQVQKGDTLRRIAEANRPEGVSLDQMLIALFRENPSAFEGDNINRLRAGSIMSVPGEAAVQAVDPAEARREVLAHSADFEAYRRKLAGTVASRPAAAEETPSRSDAGAIVPKVSEPVRGAGGDRVRVSGASGQSPAGKGADDASLVRLQALEEELASRDKALEEANSRLAALEANIRQMQQLLELRNESLAKLQQQAAGAPTAGAPATPAPNSAAAPDAAPAPRTGPTPAASPAPAAQTPKPPQPPASAPVAEPGLLQALLDDPAMLAGGGGILVLLLAYAGLKVRQRRQQGQARDEAEALVSKFPPATNSVFGATGGQSVNTGESSVLHTDFSQSGLSAIDTDEGVDPVAEADVYMAYGRDAQAEEILLDALKSDSSRIAIYLKLLEIYAQRKNLKAFETTATDLYSRTGGGGPDWEKAAEMGRRIDPDNPLYQVSGGATPGGAPGAALAAGAAVAAGVAAAATTEAMQTTRTPDAMPVGPAFAVPVDTQTAASVSALAMSGEASGPVVAEQADDVGIEALPEVDANALDFDLDAGLEFGEPAPTAGAVVPASIEIPTAAGQEGAMELDLDIGDLSTTVTQADLSPQAAPTGDAMDATAVGDGLDLASVGQALEFDLAPVLEAPEAVGTADVVDLNATVVGAEAGVAADAEGASDLEKTTFDSSLLDFDFNLEDSGEPEAAPSAVPSLDLTSIDLNLEVPPLETAPVESANRPAADGFDLAMPEIPAASAEPSAEMVEEVNTKLELARAYEEMGDAEGARELLDEVLREGNAEQREAASRLKERLA